MNAALKLRWLKKNNLPYKKQKEDGGDCLVYSRIIPIILPYLSGFRQNCNISIGLPIFSTVNNSKRIVLTQAYFCEKFIGIIDDHSCRLVYFN